MSPRKPGTPCATPGCPEVVDGARCEKHRREKQRREAARRRREGKHDNFYCSAAWRAARAQQLKREPICTRCRDEFNRTREATVVHHRVPRDVAPAKALASTNLTSRCKTCHNQEHPEKGGAR